MAAISVVICTVENSHRDERLAEVIGAIQRQKGVETELILVWQGGDGSRAPKFDGVSILATDFCGVSEARNLGADAATHDVIGFCDDDTLPRGDDFYSRALALLDQRGLDFLTCNIAFSGKIAPARVIASDIALSRTTVVGNMMEPGILVRRRAFMAARFDNTLGIGCLHGASEGLDLGARLLAKGCRGWRSASLVLDHPAMNDDATARNERTFFYMLANGAVLLQHGFYATLAFRCAKASGRLLISVATLDGARAANASICLVALLLGPLLPRRPARLMPLNRVVPATMLVETAPLTPPLEIFNKMSAVSVVICTIENSGREARLAEVIRKIKLQKGTEIEIVLVWQGNPTSVPTFDHVRILATDLCGSGESRNRGAAVATHDVIAFYDDDTYPVGDDFFVRALAILEDRNLEFLTCNISSSGTIQSSAAVAKDVVIARSTLIGNMWEPGLLIRRAAFEDTRFDPTLGIGCLHGSSEGFDFGARLLAKGYSGERVAALLVDHPPLTQDANISTERAFFYSLGNGATLIQRRFYSAYVWQCMKAMGRLLFSLLRLNSARARTACVRLLALLLGPLLPRRPARLLPPGHIPRPSQLMGPDR